MLPLNTFRHLSIATTIALAALSAANDGGLAVGGSPGLLKGHPTVSMTSELIRITVGEKTMTADCRFVFTNHGPACTVRMGFPDQGTGASDPDEEDDSAGAMKKPPKTTFSSFKSYVAGHEVPTKLIRADEEGQYWHSKTVRFPAHGELRIRDVYTQATGGGISQIGKQQGFASQIGYIVHTGASWHGNIGRTEILVTFRDPTIKKTPNLVAYPKDSKGTDGRFAKLGKFPKNAIVWRGPCKPTMTGKTLRFIRTNWRPKPSDDVELTYDFRPLAAETKPATRRSQDQYGFQEQDSAVKQELHDKYAALSDAFGHRDFARLGSLMTSDYKWVPLDGEVAGKRQYLKMLGGHRAGAVMTYQVEGTEIHVGKALAKTKQTFSEPTPKDDYPKLLFRNVYSYVLSDTWIKTPNGWRLSRSEMQG